MAFFLDSTVLFKVHFKSASSKNFFVLHLNDENKRMVFAGDDGVFSSCFVSQSTMCVCLCCINQNNI